MWLVGHNARMSTADEVKLDTFDGIPFALLEHDEAFRAHANHSVDLAIAGMGATMSYSRSGWTAFSAEFDARHQFAALAVRRQWKEDHRRLLQAGADVRAKQRPPEQPTLPLPRQPWCSWCNASIATPIPASGKKYETRMVHHRTDRHVDGGEIAMRCGPVVWKHS